MELSFLSILYFNQFFLLCCSHVVLQSQSFSNL